MEEAPRKTRREGGAAAMVPRVVGVAPRYPLAANVSFSPGGLSYSGTAEESLQLISDPASMASVIASAQRADDTLRQYSLWYAYRQFGPSMMAQNTKHHLPSLAALVEAVWGRYTGCVADQVKPWADALLAAYWREETTPECVPTTEDQIAALSPTEDEALKPAAEVESTVARLKRFYEQQSEALGTQRPHRPCGYIFKRGDIAWNCRSCQTDPTCVICNDCFQQSQHEGHEVYFHRTTPGGCCDCGDAEAWFPAGCCERHRPPQSKEPADSTTATSLLDDDPIHVLRPPEATPPLPPRLAAALTVIIRAAVSAICDAVDGAGIGSDAVQWTKRWADEAARVANQAPYQEDYRFRRAATDSAPATLQTFVTFHKTFPDNFRLQLRLHNDDVHTFDEVIDALHDPRSRIADGSLVPPPTQYASLVSLRENATEMTHHVDADGQVTVKTYNNIAAAMKGFQRLKSRGLQCAVVTTAQVDAEHRARALALWLTDVAAAHPAAQAALVEALESSNVDARMMPAWCSGPDWRQKFQSFPPHWDSSYMTREEAERLHELAGIGDDFYAPVPYRLPSPRYHKSPHALWGTLPSLYKDTRPVASLHPYLGERSSEGGLSGPPQNRLTESIYIIDTDLRKQQEGERITRSLYPHKLPGLHLISGIGTTRVSELSDQRPPLPSAMELRHLLATSSFRAPVSPLLLLLLLDPYPTKQLRASVHALFLSLFTNARFKSRFAGALAVAYRPLSTLFCAGIGTDADTPLHFTVQIFTAGSLVRALGQGPSLEQLLRSEEEEPGQQSSIGIFVPPIAHIIVRCIHTNLLGSTKEVNMILNNTVSQSDDDSQEEGFHQGNVALLPALTYVAGEHPLMTPLPAAPDDGFLDSRSTRHKRLPHLLRDLDYVIETPGTALRLLLPNRYPVYQGPALSLRGEDVLTFSAVFARMLRLAQGMDPQKRKISGGHVEYEQQRWLEAFGLSLNLGGTRDALADSPGSCMTIGDANDESHILIRESTRNIIAALLREVKLWLYREGLLETGLPISPGAANLDLAQVEALQRSTLHASNTLFDVDGSTSLETGLWTTSSIALSCATGIKMTEIQLTLIENALKLEAVQRQEQRPHSFGTKHASCNGPALGEWLRVPHSPLAGDSLSFHLPLHRAIAKCVKSVCSIVVPEAYIVANRSDWWKLPVLDDAPSTDSSNHLLNHPLIPLIRPTLRTSNCKVVWSGGPDCTPQEAQRRRTRSKALSANLAVAKVLHSLADHPIRCLAASQQIERHLWTRNGTSVAGMAMNYSSAPLCHSFRDLDLLLVQLSASGMSCGLGARRIFSLLLSRFSLDGYLCDPERRLSTNTTGQNSFSSGLNMWVNPPRLQDADHAVVLAESFFSTLCVIVTELPLFPPTSPSDNSPLCQSIRRELIHALAAEPRTHSEAMTAASCGLSRGLESEGTTGKVGSAGLFRTAFSSVLKEIGKQKSQSSSRASSGPPAFELKADFCDEYDPTFFHLRRQEHQHAMDVIARLRRQKWGDDKDTHCLPIVCVPPKAHPRFLPCRLLLHLEAVDAALRRALLFALTNGSWVPPPEPFKVNGDDEFNGLVVDVAGVTSSTVSSPGSSDVPIRTFNRRVFQSQSSVASFSKNGKSDPFSGEVVSTSSVSFLEVLQILTLQVHTLEECASLHMCCPDLDDEGRALSSSLSINSYLRRLVSVPESLVDVWAFRPYPDGPLKSRGSGANRGSILGFLIALYEHRADHGGAADEDVPDYGGKDDDHGGARNLASSGLKWLLRVVHALVDGASSLSSAIKSATTGTPVRSTASLTQVDVGPNSWTINEDVRSTIGGMLSNLVDLWPKPLTDSASPEKNSAKGKEARRAAQQRVMDMMKRKQAAFAETISKIDAPSGADSEVGPEETDLCIICRCDDTDGENNGPIGYLGHVQRSRMLQMYSSAHASKKHEDNISLMNAYRVVGHMGCQLRETEAMDSKPLNCLPKGSIVRVLKSKVSSKYDILSRRVYVQHRSTDASNQTILSEGWASVQSSQGYVILSPLSSLCFNNSRWGSTRPIIKQCGHAAHLKCVETHMLSLHQRAAGEQPYDGRFAANINDGEFLCPLCKQLSNILIPRDTRCSGGQAGSMNATQFAQRNATSRSLRTLLSVTRFQSNPVSPLTRKALEDFGSHLHAAMIVPWERTTATQKVKQERWHAALHKWDFEEGDGDPMQTETSSIKNVMRLLRQQLISWASVGHSAAALEAGSRGIAVALPFGTVFETADPWSEYSESSFDTHPMMLELKRSLTGSSGLLEILLAEISDTLGGRKMNTNETSVVGSCLADIVDGTSWLGKQSSADLTKSSSHGIWGGVSALVSQVPSHVAQDGTITVRSEAKATAAAMWTVKGTPFALNGKTEPPAPFAIRQFFTGQIQSIDVIPPDWGTMCPFVEKDLSDIVDVPFRAGVACGFLYTPLLAWDLYTLAGALFSFVLANEDCDLPTGVELLNLSHTLLIGRIIQALITPGAFDYSDEMELDDEDCWTPDEADNEGYALTKLVTHCYERMKENAFEGRLKNVLSLDGSTLLAGIGRAILPFARGIVLILRACTSCIRERRERNGSCFSPTDADKILVSSLCRADLLTVEDGFHVVKALQCPRPSGLLDGTWFALINRWILCAIGLEKVHGFIGGGVATTSFPPPVAFKPPANADVAPQRSMTPMVCDESSDDNMITDTLVGGDLDDVGPVGTLRLGGMDELLQGDMDDSDEEFTDGPDDADEMISFELPSRLAVALPDHGDGRNSSDNSTESPECDLDPSDRKFANVSTTPIIPYQPSFLGTASVGPGRRGSAFDFALANELMVDMSHLGCVHRKDSSTFSLIRLPKSFVELYNIVNKIKGRDDNCANDENDEIGTSETSICLLTGAVMRSGSGRRMFSRHPRPPGACTLHARKTASGIGIFFLVQKCTVLLMHNNKSAYSPSLYVDEHGEEDPQLKRGRPLFLNETRYRALELLWRQQCIPREVAQIRSTSDRVIRDNWY